MTRHTKNINSDNLIENYVTDCETDNIESDFENESNVPLFEMHDCNLLFILMQHFQWNRRYRLFWLQM